MTLLARELYRSRLIKNSVVVFDGFTGFTPVQLQVLKSMLVLCKDVIVTVTVDRNDPAALFSFANRTIASLYRIAGEENIPVKEKEISEGSRFKNSAMMEHLEKHIFRYPLVPFENQTDHEIELQSCLTLRDEVRSACRKIRELVKKTGCAYRDIAVIAGDLDTYESEIQEEFDRYGIPVYLDRTRGIVFNPFLEFLKSALQVQIEDYSYDSVFAYLKTGMTDLTEKEIDDLENYVLAVNIRGKKAYHRMFSRRSSEMKKREDSTEELQYLNGIREKLVQSLEKLSCRNCELKQQVTALYEFLVSNHAEEKLNAYAEKFRETDFVKQKEYEQVYGLVMDLFDQMVELLGTEKMDTGELLEILEAGLEEIEVGSIPKSVDRVTVGDMERTRLKPVKHLFLLGANDGLIPKNSSRGGIISDLDREFLKDTDIALSPTPREKMEIQRYYLYLQLTKPSETLHISYAGMDREGNPLKPSYLTEMIRRLFPQTGVCQEGETLRLPGNEYEIQEKLSLLFQRYAAGIITEEEQEMLYLLKDVEPSFDEYLNRAFYCYRPDSIQKEIAAVLYGTTLYASISKMERYASCAYAHFLQYGLSLKEREEYGMEAKDVGSIFHSTLEKFADKLKEQGQSFSDFDEETGEAVLDRAFEEACVEYSEALVYDNATFLYGKSRMKSILQRTVFTLSKQLKDGSFKLEDYEMKFEHVENLDELKLQLVGKIDRLDTYVRDNRLYVKVIDYKSGDKDFNLLSFYEGRQLQLVIYLGEAAREMEKKYRGKTAVPAAALYYHMEDPMVPVKEPESDEAIARKVFENLRMKGILTADREALKAMDRKEQLKSDIIPLAYTKNGEFAAAARVFKEEDLKMLYDYAMDSVCRMGREIIQGNIEKNPCEEGQTDSCTYCRYRDVCTFDKRMPGMKMRKPADLDKDQIMEKIHEKMEK